MDRLIYLLAKFGVAMVQALPLRWVAQLGRCGGELVYWIDARHRRMALKNLTRCFGTEKSATEIRALAHENFRRIGENYACAVRSAAMSEGQMAEVLAFHGMDHLRSTTAASEKPSRVMATGHFGNFELLARLGNQVAGYRCAATYRGVRPAALDRLLFELRSRVGALFFERRTGANQLKRAMNEGGLLLVLVCDQSTRDGGLELPFLGHPCFQSRAPAVMAARYGCDLFVPICYRTGLGRWVIEIGEPIATREQGRRRTTDDITRDVNRAFEVAVRRDPANWFWVHNRWKPLLAAAVPNLQPVSA